MRLGITTGDRLRQVAGEGGRVRLAGVVASKQERVTERTRLVRLIVSDHTAQFEVTAFSELMGQAASSWTGRHRSTSRPMRASMATICG